MEIKIDKDEIKNNLTIEQVFDLLAELGAEPRMEDGRFVCQTICHNHPGHGSHKLYYYDNTKLFKCYTDCGDTFDIFELVCKHKNTIQEYKEFYTREGTLGFREWKLYDAINFVILYYNLSKNSFNFSNNKDFLKDWEIFNKYEEISLNSNKQIVELKVYDKKILQFLPHPRILPWEQEGITREVMEARGICYDPHNEGIVIPHYDIKDNLIGIRERTLIKENEKYGKYKPAILNGKMYNHPLGFNLYNLNNSKNNIKQIKKAIVGEGEKFSLMYASLFGIENDITCACCGSNLINYQFNLLISLGVEEIVIAFDKQFQEIGDEEWKRWTKKLTTLHEKYSPYVKISFMFDKKDLLGYKDSPIDRGKDIFLQLFEERIIL